MVEKTFVRITNQQVYQELCEMKAKNEQDHQRIITMISGYRSQVSQVKWALSGVTGLLLLNLGWFVSHLLK